MLRLSLIVLVSYVIYLGFIVFCHFQSSLILAILLFSSILLLVGIVKLVMAFKRNEIERKHFYPLLLLLVPWFGVCLNIKWFDNHSKDIIISAYSDGVMSGADVFFYQDGSLTYCSNSLVGEKCYHGNYYMSQDTFVVDYLEEIPSFHFNKLMVTKNELLFFDHDGKVVYHFQLSIDNKRAQSNE